MEEPYFNTRDPRAPWEVNTQIPNIPDILPHKHGCSEPGAAVPPHPLPPPPYPSDINKVGQSRGKTSARLASLGPQSPLPPATPAGRNEETPGALVHPAPLLTPCSPQGPGPPPSISPGAAPLEVPPSALSHLLQPGPLTPNGQGMDLSYEIPDSFSEQWARL